MAITRAQQARQMLKKGSEPVVQGGVDNYLGKQPQVVVPRKWQSGPDKPPTELAYITEAEKKLLLKADIHGSLKEGPNEGPAGIMSLDSFGDAGGGGFSGADVSAAERGEKPSGMSQQQADEFRGGAIAAGAGARDDDTANAKKEAEKIKRQVEKRKREAAAAITKEEKKEARRNYKKTQQRLRADKLRRQSKLQAILGGKKTYNTFKYNPKTRKYEIDETVDLPGQGELQEDGTITGANPFGINEKEYQDLISSLPSYEGPPESPEQKQERINNYLAKKRANTDLSDPLNQLFETNDRFSGVNLEAFQNEFNMPKTGITSLDIALGFASPFLKAGTKKTKEFFSGTEDGLGKNIFGKPRKSVLEAGKYTYNGLPIDPTTFAMLDPALMDDVYKDYIGRRMSGEIDAYGNPTPPTKDDESDPCLGPNPPAYCFTRNQDPTPTAPPIFTPAFRFMNRGGMVEDAPVGTGIMDLEAARQMMFLGGIAKGIKKGLKSVTRAAKKVFKSPFGKAALLAAPFVMGGGGGFGFKDILKKGLLKDVAGDFTLKNLSGGKIAALSGLAGLLASKQTEEDDFDIDEYYRTQGLSDFIASLGQRNRFLAEGGRVGLQEGGGIEQRLEQLGGDVTSAEEMLQGINERLQTAESSLGSGGGIGGLPGAGGPKIDEAFFNPQRPSGPGSLQQPTQLLGIRPNLNVQLRPGFANRPLLESLVPPTGTLEQPKAVQPAKFSSVEDAFADAQKNAQEARAGGFLGRVVLPGEMSFEDFSKNLNIFGQPMQLPASGGLGGAMKSPIQRAVGLAKGGKAEPVAKKTMPLLDLDGQEMDFRAEGGFVPIGRMEKADDVPARLSKNEFVFTADAVRNAGDGDIDKGAEVMYNMMKNLEKGGNVSEESQGLEGAREMFQTAQRLGEVI